MIITKGFSIKYNDIKVNTYKCASQNEVTCWVECNDEATTNINIFFAK